MSLIFKRNVLIFAGILFITIIKVEMLIPYINILLAILCFYNAYKINKLIER